MSIGQIVAPKRKFEPTHRIILSSPGPSTPCEVLEAKKTKSKVGFPDGNNDGFWLVTWVSNKELKAGAKPPNKVAGR